MTEMSYDAADLPELRYVKLIYTSQDNEVCEIIPEIRLLGNNIISLYTESQEDFNIICPQNITIKFVAEDCAYVSISTLQKVSRVNNITYFNVLPPQTIYKQQNRKYYRIDLQRNCILVATDKKGNSTAFMSKLVNFSAGGIMIDCLEIIPKGKHYLELQNYKTFNIILFLEIDLVLNLSASYVRQEYSKDSLRYAFEYINMKAADTNTLCQYITKKQVERLQSKNK